MTERKLIEKLRLWVILHPNYIDENYADLSCEKLCKFYEECITVNPLHALLQKTISPRFKKKYKFAKEFQCIKWLDEE